MNKKSMKEYRIWKAMKSRCYSPSNKKTGYYQKENINVCDRWRNSFENFLEDMGKIPGDEYSIERIDYAKDYCPENCKWIKFSEQSKNRRTIKLYTYNGKTMILKDWAKYFNINYNTLHKRLTRYNLSFEEAIKKDCYNRLVKINDKEMTVTEWCKFYNLKSGDVFSRIHRGWSKEDAILKNQEDIVQTNLKELD